MNIIRVKMVDRYPIAGVNDYCIMMLSRDNYGADIKNLTNDEQKLYPFPRHIIFGDLNDLNKPLINMYDANFCVKNDIYYARHSLVNDNGYLIYAPTVVSSVWNDHITVMGYDRTLAFNIANMLYSIISEIVTSTSHLQGNYDIRNMRGVLRLYFMADMIDKDKVGYSVEDVVNELYNRFYDRYEDALSIDFYLVEKQ